MVSAPEAVNMAIAQAVAYRDRGEGESAVAMIRKALRDHPRDSRLWQTLGTIYRALDRSADAVMAFGKAVEYDAGNARAAYGVAQSMLEAGRPAIVAFDRAAAVAPGDGGLILGRVAAHIATGQGDAAIATLASIVRSNPAWLDGHATLSRLRWQQGDRTTFASSYVEALQAEPGNLPLWLALIDALIQVEMFETASSVIARANMATGAVEPLLLPEAVCASELGDVAAADAAFARMSGVETPLVQERLLRHLIRTGRLDRAAALADAAADRGEDGPVWPYISLIWRVTDDARWAWLEDPVLIRSFDLDVDLDALADRLRTLHVLRADPLGQSVRRGTQTDGPLFALEAPEIRSLRAEVVGAVETYVAGLGAADKRHPVRRHAGKRFRFSGSWSVRLTEGGHHSPHVHSQGWLSSACHIVLPDGANTGALEFGRPPANLNLDLPAFKTVQPKSGRLILFPSTTWHGTQPIDDGERLTVAFDVAPLG